MPHPQMFDDADPLLARVRAICLAYPGAQERLNHGRPDFFTTRGFCHYGGSVIVDRVWHPHDQSILVKPDPMDADALAQDPRVFRPAYLGPKGWIGLDLGDETDWAEVEELIDASYRLTAPVRLVRALDERGRAG